MQSRCIIVPLMCRSPGRPAGGQDRKLGPSGAITVVSLWRNAYPKMLISLYPLLDLFLGPVTRDCTTLVPVDGRTQQTKVELS